MPTYHYFSNEKPNSAINNTGQFGIVPRKLNPANIPDDLTDASDVLGKIGSSMPSPFARLYLFSAAFNEVNAIEQKEQGQGHEGVKDPVTGNRIESAYHKLVGEFFDMLEFLYRYGDREEFHVIQWNINQECQKLAKSEKAHQLLGKALSEAHLNTALGEINTIYLFTWQTEEGDLLIGGTTPISLIYTSANIKREIQEKGLSNKFTGAKGNALFTDYPLPLHKRDSQFKKFVYCYRLNDINLNNKNGKFPLRHLDKYIQDSLGNYDSKMQNAINKDPSYAGIKNLTSQGANIRSAGIPIYCSDHTPKIDTDYQIEATIQIYQTENVNGANVGVQTPLVLSNNGIDGLKYVNKTEWTLGIHSIPDVLPASLSGRTLPGFQGTKYPYITIDDFLEDKIIEVSYNLDNSNFFTGSTEDRSFLLPLKKEFFKFFTLNDLVKNGTPTGMLTMDVNNETEDVTVEIHVPLVSGKKMTFHRTYNSSKKVNCYDVNKTFDLALFPMYRITDDLDNNIYQLFLGSTTNVGLSFYKAGKLGAKNPKETVEIENRSKEQNINTTHIRIPSSFDIIEVNVEGSHGLVIPLFKEVLADSTEREKTFSFCIDFGTTNTHVAYADCQPPIASDNVKDFKITKNDLQVATLHNNADGAGEFATFTTYFLREFLPFEIGIGNIKFPMRTATCEVKTHPSALKLFANTNVGFNYNQELSKTDQYKTNIKWDRNDILSFDRMREYFTEMLWLMKNKSLLNKGSNIFDLVVTYPQAMRDRDVSNLKQALEEAKNSVKCNGVNITYQFESITPYYAYLNDLQFGTPYANIDIGGGTTDFLYVNPGGNEAIAFSAFFAANDLWNDGIDNDGRTNGFVKYYQKEYNSLDIKSTIDEVIKNTRRSEDIISYLFANDDKSRFSAILQKNDDLMLLPIIHFSSLIYYLAYVLDKGGVELPSQISFTGMGSKYIHLISNNASTINKLVNSIFNYYGRKFGKRDFEKIDIKVQFAPQPKIVTAKGGLLVKRHNNPIQPDLICLHGYIDEDSTKNIKYKDISNKKGVVLNFYDKFLDIFVDEKNLEVISELELNIDTDVVNKLRQYAKASFEKQCISSGENINENARLNEPMFFWPLKDALYNLGKDLSNS